MQVIISAVLQFGRYIGLAGLAGMGFIIYLIWNSSHGGGVPSIEQLTTVDAYVQQITQFTETRRRGGGKRVYYEFKVKTKEGVEEVWKMGNVLKESAVSNLIEENITVKLDAADKEIYGVTMGKKEILSYEELAKNMQASADDMKNMIASPLYIALAILAMLIGVASLYFQYKRPKPE